MQEMITAIYCEVDDYCQAFKSYCTSHLLPGSGEASEYFPKCSVSLSEIMCIVILFHLSQYRTFKWYYKSHVCQHWRGFPPQLPS